MPLVLSEFMKIIEYETSIERSRGNKECYVVPASCILVDPNPKCISVSMLPVMVDKVEFDDALMTAIPDDERDVVLDWIASHMEHIKSVNEKHSSYGLKHWLQADTGIYLTNNQFKHAMLIAGFDPVDETELNWLYRISERRLNNPINTKAQKGV